MQALVVPMAFKEINLTDFESQSVDQKPPLTTSISLAPLSLNCSALHLNTQQLTQHSDLPLSLPPTNPDDISISIQFNLHHS
ncbi:hypothetical protein PGT21_028138 [Puccinia graminis f. sp. tritici]|uniref:Uncharacterized protein n=1 Tax=Puccinia graminis f. sp. tritici TaxID=56615 RepID=A0A5B0NZD1_PUCGR|nr:hypothetical protein PGT21_028138 [Puccinia graminis f. sp. tritici]